MSCSRPLPDTRDIGSEETHEAYDRRIWKDKIWIDKNQHIFIPPTNLKKCLEEAARYIGQTVPGKKQKTWTKFFERGLAVLEPIVLTVKADDLTYEDVFVPANGKRGDGTRVYRRFPIVAEGWTGVANIVVLDQTITPRALFYHLEEAGKSVGFGRFSPRTAGYYGRFAVSDPVFNGKKYVEGKET
jgi:hypothetical protein